jgi:hypothetical protein
MKSIGVDSFGMTGFWDVLGEGSTGEIHYSFYQKINFSSESPVLPSLKFSKFYY